MPESNEYISPFKTLLNNVNNEEQQDTLSNQVAESDGRDLDSTMGEAVKFDPDQSSKNSQLSAKAGIEPQIVENNFDKVNQLQQKKDMGLRRLLTESPETSKFVSNMDNAKQSHDDIGNLQKVEHGFFNNAARRIGERGAELTGQLSSFMGQLYDIEEPDPKKPNPYFRESGPNTFTKLSSSLFKSAGETLKDTDFDAQYVHTVDSVKKAFNDPETGKLSLIGESIMFGAETGLASIPDMIAVVAAMPAYVAARSSEIGEVRAEFKGTPQTFKDTMEAAPFAVGSAILERIMPASALNTLTRGQIERVGNNVIKEALKQGATEAGTEFIQEGVLEYIGERIGTGAELNVGEAAERGAFGALAGGQFGAAIGATTQTARNVVDNIKKRTNQSIKDTAKTEEIINSVEDSELAKRNPDAMRNFMKQLGEESDTETIYVDPEGVQELLQSEQGADIQDLESFKVISEKLPEAEATGSKIEIPVDSIPFLAKDEILRPLQPYMTLTIDAMSPSQLKDANVQETISAIAKEESKDVESEFLVQENVQEQLVGAGFTPETSNQYAQLYTAAFKTFGEKTGRDPLELYEELGFKITSQVDPAIQAEARSIQEIDVILDRLRADDRPNIEDINVEEGIELTEEQQVRLQANSRINSLDDILQRSGIDVLTETNEEIKSRLLSDSNQELNQEQDFGDINITEEVEVDGIDDAINVTESAQGRFESLQKRQDSMRKLRKCIRG